MGYAGGVGDIRCGERWRAAIDNNLINNKRMRIIQFRMRIIQLRIEINFENETEFGNSMQLNHYCIEFRYSLF